jgi:Tfp pilus assembly protein PilF
MLLKDSFDPVTLILHPMANVEGRTVSATSLTAPKDSLKAFEKATKAMQKGKWKEAQSNLEKALQGYPRYAAAWSELANVYAETKETGKAREAFRQAIAIDPKFVAPYFGLAEIAMREHKWQEMAEHTGTLLKLDPYGLPGAYAYDAMAHLNLDRLDAAEKSAREGLKIDQVGEVPKNHHLLAVVLMRKGDYAAAAAELREYLQAVPKAADAEFARRQLAACEERAGVQGGANASRKP